MTLREDFEKLPEGKKLLASARLRRGLIKALHEALSASNMSQSDLARNLKKSRSAVGQVLNGDGNVEVETISDYLFAMGAELQVALVSAGLTNKSSFTGWANKQDNFKFIVSTGVGRPKSPGSDFYGTNAVRHLKVVLESSLTTDLAQSA